MVYGLGRFLQLAGLILLPLAVIMELNNSLDRDFGVSDEVIMMTCGVCCFVLGRMIEGYAK